MRGWLLVLGLTHALMAGAWSDDEQERWHRLNQELRCLVCQNQSIADSNAELAQDLRAQVREMIEAGRTDAEIRAYMTDRYGDFVLYRPPFKPETWLLWIGPFAMLGVALLIAWRVARGRRRAAEVPPTPALDRILDEVDRD